MKELYKNIVFFVAVLLLVMMYIGGFLLVVTAAVSFIFWDLPSLNEITWGVFRFYVFVCILVTFMFRISEEGRKLYREFWEESYLFRKLLFGEKK